MYVFSFGCMIIHTITEQFPTVNNAVICCESTEIDKRSKYLKRLKGLSYIYFLTLACLQDNPSCRPTAKQCESILKGSLKFVTYILRIANGLPPKPMMHKCHTKTIIPFTGKSVYNPPDIWMANQWVSCVNNGLWNDEILKTQQTVLVSFTVAMPGNLPSHA